MFHQRITCYPNAAVHGKLCQAFSPILTHSHVKLIFYYLNDHTI